MKKTRPLLLFLPLLLLTGCCMDIEYHFEVRMYNYSGHDIVSAIYRDYDRNRFCINDEFPETFFYGYDEATDELRAFEATEFIQKDNEAETLMWYNETPGNYFYYNDNLLTVYIFHADTLRAHPWEEICEKKKILARYDITNEDLKKLRCSNSLCKIYYPPTPEMKDIKMWPSYEEILSQYEVKTFTAIP